MTVRCLLTVAVLGLAGEVSAAVDVRNPALNPVTFLDAPGHTPLDLIVAGQPRFVIAYDGMAEHDSETGEWLPSARGTFGRSIEKSVTALQTAVRQVTGVEVALVDLSRQELPGQGLVILLGPSAQMEALKIDTRAMAPESFVVRSFERGVAIAGYDASTMPEFWQPMDEHVGRFRVAGTLWGVYDFVERFLGIRYYYPGIGVVIPQVTDLTIEPVAYTDRPTYPERTKWNLFMDFGRNGENWPWDPEQYAPNYWDFFDFWRMANASRFVLGHTPNRWAEVHGKDHPELFYRDAAGKLYMDPQNPSANVYDVSRRETAEQYIEDVARFYETGWDEPWKNWHHPNSEYIPWGLPDNYVVVENERTAALLNPGLGRFGLMSDVMARFHIWLCELAAERWQGVKVSGYAYAHHRLPPVREWEFPDNFVLQQCHFNNIGLFIYPEVADFEESTTRQWHELLGRPVKTYTYWGSTEYPMLIQVPGAVEYFRRMRPYIDGVYFDGGGSWPLEHLTWYVAFRLAWNPDFDADAALSEYCRLMYGPAEPTMRALIELLIERWDEYSVTLDPLAPMHHVDRDPVYGKVFPPEVVAQIRGLLDEAEAAVPAGSIEAMRVQFLRDGMARFFEQSAALADLPTPTLEVRRIEDTAIAIDGQLGDAGWQGTLRLALRTPMTGGEAKTKTSMRAGWSATALYLSFEMVEGATWELRATATGRDGRIWDDDCIEVFLSPGTERDLYYQVAINSEGAIFDLRGQQQPAREVDAGFDLEGVEVATSVGENRWYLEMRVPFAALAAEPPAIGDEWAGNFIRNKVTVPKEYTSFAPTLGNNHDARYWAPLVFAGAGM